MSMRHDRILELMRLDSLMAVTDGREDVCVAMLDGPIAATHPDLAGSKLRQVGSSTSVNCENPRSVACQHGTFVAGLLAGRRESAAPGICPGCTLLVRPIYSESREGDGIPRATPNELAEAIAECVQAGAHLVNVSGGIPASAITADAGLTEVLGQASRRGVVVIAAAGNEGGVGRSAITGHPWVLPVVPYRRDGRPMALSNLGRSIGRYGVGAPGQDIASLNAAGGIVTMSGSSVATPLVTGAAALLWSLVPTATAAEIKGALSYHQGRPRTTITPPLLDARAAHHTLAQHRRRRNDHAEHGQWAAFPGRPTATSPAPAWVHRR